MRCLEPQSVRTAGETERLLLTAPHCCAWVPSDLRPRIGLTGSELADGADLGTTEIVQACSGARRVYGTINRLLLDLNRARGDRSPDGVFRTRDFADRAVFRPNEGMRSDEQDVLLAAHYDPFHAQVREALAAPSTLFFVEVHSMDSDGGSDSMTDHACRSDIVLGNFGDDTGRPSNERGHTTCSAEVMANLRCLVEAHFAGIVSSISFNGVFYGGWNTGYYGSPRRGCQSKPGVQIEFNKRLFLRNDGEIALHRLEDVSARFARMIEDLDRFVGDRAVPLSGSLWSPRQDDGGDRGTSEGGARSIVNAWDAGASGWGKAAGTQSQGLVDSVFRRYHEVMAGLLHDELGSDDGVLCDMGSGEGAITARLLHLSAAREVHLVDADSAALAVAHEWLATSGIPNHTWERDILRDALPFRGATLDAIVSVNVLHNFPHFAKRRLLSETARVLRPGGRLVIVDVLIGSSEERSAWKDVDAIRQRVTACRNYDSAQKKCILAHYADPTCTWSIWYTLDNEYVTSTANMLHWLADTELFGGITARHGSLSDYVIAAIRNDRSWAPDAANDPSVIDDSSGTR